ncbi:MAG TPA: NADH dehydrogenase (quinone) subunit D [Acidimicrobiia bacterium]|jgi:NADH-quinone oxidoreductase subunit D|nr:NADH dehydrogenase (quinone) subunit D [Acidimicrobiia bacterium]
MSDDTKTLDVWVAGTEEPELTPTDEGAQEISIDESGRRLDEQFGRVVEDDYVFDDEAEEDERMILNMGPQHPSTHGVLRLQIELEGEIIRRTKPIIGYLHTGMEKTGEQLNFSQGGTNVTRMDYLAPFHNELAYSLAVERLLGIDVPPRAAAIRILLTELNRCSSHLVALATNGMDIGAISMMMYGFREREQILAFFEKTTGLRMNHNFIRPGGVAADLPPGWKDEVAAIIEEFPRRLDQYDDLLENNPIWVARTKGVGVLSAEEATAYGITGPTLRSTGVDWDIRKAFPYSGIDQFEFEVPLGEHGDVYDRYRIRVEEIKQSLSIVEQVMDTIPKGDFRVDDRKVTPPPRARIDESMEALIHHFKLFTEGYKVPAGETYVAVESPRGELGCYLVSDGGANPYRMHTRAPSFANLQALPIAMADSLMADTVATIASLDPVMGDVDR